MKFHPGELEGCISLPLHLEVKSATLPCLLVHGAHHTPRILTREHLLEPKGLRFNHSVTEHFMQGSVLVVLGDLVGLGRDPRIFISHECTGGADPLG